MIFAVSLAALLAPAVPVWATMEDDCAQSADRILRMDACTALINSGKVTGRKLAIAHFNHGAANDSIGEYARAIEDYDRALSIAPDIEAAHFNRANAYFVLGEFEKAIEGFGETVRIDPDSAAAFNNRGEANSLLGENQRAIDDFNQALRIDPGYTDAYRNRGVVYESMGQYDRAVKDWDKEVQLGGAERAKWWQEYLSAKGYYSGEIDGVYSPGIWAAMMECARDPDC
ncbi:MAG TPA: tetratricopeptide repeat protein [Thermohalobaculum sp.]|nr:tetratricopeptide repeat protein [Thermohalobaculum sp.]